MIKFFRIYTKNMLILAFFLSSFIFLDSLLLDKIIIGAESKKTKDVEAKSDNLKYSLWDVYITDVKVSKLNKKNKTRKIQYKLDCSDKNIVTPQNPVWVFLKFSPDGGKTWMNTDDTIFENDLDPSTSKDSLVNKNLSGDAGIVGSVGKKTIVWDCGENGTNFDGKDVMAKLRVIQMCKIPEDKDFKVGGNGAQSIKSGSTKIDQFYMAEYPATYSLYSEFLNEWANFHDINSDYNHKFWFEEMGKDESGGLDMSGGLVGQGALWTAKKGRERWPAGHITYWVAHDLALWAGLELSTEPEWEKAARGIGGADGIKYSWGNNPVPSNEICNFGNYIKQPTDVRAYEVSWLKNDLANTYGLREMTGNVWEWQDTYWYDGGGEYDPSQNFTDYDIDVKIENRYKYLDQLKADAKISDDEWKEERKKIALKGWRVIKGGSFFDVMSALDASSRIVGDTKVRHSAVGCRFVKR